MGEDATTAATLEATIYTSWFSTFAIPQVTSATDWKRRTRARWLLTLPSGNVIEAKRPDWNALLVAGVVKAEELISLTVKTQALVAQELPVGEIYRQVANEVLPVARAIAPYVFIKPVVVLANGHAPTVDDDVLTPEDIGEMDLLAVFGWANGTATAVQAVEIV